MKCCDFEQYEMEYIDGNLSPDKTDELKEHIATCEHCQKEFQVYADIIANIGNIPELTPDDAFTDNVICAVKALPKPCRGLRFLVLCSVTAAISSLVGVLNLALLNQSQLTATLSASPLTIHLVKLIELLAKADNFISAFMTQFTHILGTCSEGLIAPLVPVCVTLLCIYALFNNSLGGIKNE